MPVQAIPTTPKRLRILGDEELVVRTHLQPADLTAFQRLLDDAPGQYALTQLKHEPRDVSVSEIKREIQRGTQLAPLYTLAQRVLPALEISNESITYYASFPGIIRGGISISGSARMGCQPSLSPIRRLPAQGGTCPTARLTIS